MLCPDDRQLVERDGDVAGLAVVLDPEALTAALRAHLPEAGIVSLEPVYAHYKPRTNCLVACRLRTSETEFLAYAKAYGPDARVKLEKTRLLQDIASPLGPGTLVSENRNIGFYFFPADHRLRGLRRLASPDTTHSLIRELCGKTLARSDTTLRHLRYKPERRYVACLETDEGPKALLKFYTPKLYRAARTAAQALGTGDPSSPRSIPASSDRHNVLAFDWLPGHLLSQTIRDPGLAEEDRVHAVELTGTALGRLHSQTPAGLRNLSRADEISRLAAQAATIAHLCPALGRLAQGIARELIASLEDISNDSTVSHGDFYDKQVLIVGGQPVILDLDEAGFAHRAMDPGLFIAHLERHRLYGRLSENEVETFTEALVRGYQLARPAPSFSSIRVYAAIGLFHLAAEPFRYRESGWRDKLQELLFRVDAILGKGSAARPSEAVAAANR